MKAKLSSDRERERWIDFLRVQPLPLEVEARPWKKPRKITANNYLWGFVYQPLVQVAGFTTTQWHEHYCGEYFGWVERITPAGHVEYKPRRTTTTNENGDGDVLKGDSFNEFLMFVESDCAKRGVFIERGAV